MVYMYHSFLIHSSADGHLGYFYILAMINSAVMNIGVHVSLSDLVFLGVYAQKWDCWVIWQFYFQFFKKSPEGGFFTSWATRLPNNTIVGSLSLLQWIFLILPDLLNGHFSLGIMFLRLIHVVSSISSSFQCGVVLDHMNISHFIHQFTILVGISSLKCGSVLSQKDCSVDL